MAPGQPSSVWRVAWCTCVMALVAACASSDPHSADTKPTFCDVLPILQSKCQRCHQNPPQHSAPFALVSYADTQVQAGTLGKRYELMREAIEEDRMPDRSQSLDPPVSPLSCEEKATLLAWLRNGAPPAPGGEDACEGASSVLLSCP